MIYSHSAALPPFLCLFRDTLNTPYFTTRNDGNPSATIPGYAPIPPEGETTTYTFPVPGSQAYYSNMYSGMRC